nr:5542_t:CDS:2 [Entrophospora candida]
MSNNNHLHKKNAKQMWSQVSDILKESGKRLKVDPNPYQAKLKRPSVTPFADIGEA